MKCLLGYNMKIVILLGELTFDKGGMGGKGWGGGGGGVVLWWNVFPVVVEKVGGEAPSISVGKVREGCHSDLNSFQGSFDSRIILTSEVVLEV